MSLVFTLLTLPSQALSEPLPAWSLSFFGFITLPTFYFSEPNSPKYMPCNTAAALHPMKQQSSSLSRKQRRLMSLRSGGKPVNDVTHLLNNVSMSGPDTLPLLKHSPKTLVIHSKFKNMKNKQSHFTIAAKRLAFLVI